MSRSGIYSRVSSIPEDDLKTVRYIKEIIKDHSDEDIYAMLEECSMDPAETIHRLSHLDTFHVVKSKRDKRKEKINKVPEEPRRRSGNQGRGSRSSRGSGSSQFVSQDAGGGRNAAVRKENGPVESREKGLHHSPFLKSRDVDGKINKLGTKSSSILINGPVEMLDDIPATGYGKKMLNVTNVTKDNADIGAEKQKMLPQPNAPVDHAPSASDLILVPSHDSHLLTPVGSIEHEVHMQCIAEPATCVSECMHLRTLPRCSSKFYAKQLIAIRACILLDHLLILDTFLTLSSVSRLTSSLGLTAAGAALRARGCFVTIMRSVSSSILRNVYTDIPHNAATAPERLKRPWIRVEEQVPSQKYNASLELSENDMSRSGSCPAWNQSW